MHTTRIARYIIVLDRYDDEDYVTEDATDQEGMEQVAAELQEAMAQTGEPVGFFRVVARQVLDGSVDNDFITRIGHSDEAVHRAAMQTLDATRTY